MVNVHDRQPVDLSIYPQHTAPCNRAWPANSGPHIGTRDSDAGWPGTAHAYMDTPTLLQNRPLFQAIYPGCLWARDNRWLLSRVQRLTEPAGDRGLLSRLEKPTRTKGGSFILVGAFNQDKTPWPPYPLPSLPPEPFSSLVLAVLGSGEGSSCSFLHHICDFLLDLGE